MTCGESRNHASVHQHTEGISNINYLLVYDNCYGISCHSLECMKLLHYHTEGVLQCRCTKYPTHHLWWSLHDPTSRVHTRSLRSSGLPIEITVQCWTLYHIRSIWHLCNTIGDAAWTEASREFSAPTSKYIWNIFLQSCVKRQAQRITSWEPTWQTYTILY